MWSDNETAQDFLNFATVAAAAAEVVRQANGRPISLGISGSWGVGKSSMIKLIRAELEQAPENTQVKYLFVEFNPWLYQGYDDARAALVETVATKLREESEKASIPTAVEKIKGVLSRVNLLRVGQLVAPSILALSLGIPPVGLIGAALNIVAQVAGQKADNSTVAAAEKLLVDVDSSSKGIVKPAAENSPQKEIQEIRKSFEETLAEMKVTLVVLIDDLDRCLPNTTIRTLEAIRLLLFMDNTAFVVAADEAMIKHAVREHFAGVDEQLVGSYYDKLVQVPIKVPPLGTQEVRAYLMLLFVENSSLDNELKVTIRTRVREQLRCSWEGKRVDKAFIESISSSLPSELISRLELADKLAPLMTTSEGIKGNPRLIKRFLNAMSIRMSLARAQQIPVEERILIKLMLFERGAPPALYEELSAQIARDPDGKPQFLSEYESKVMSEENAILPEPWDSAFVKEWLSIQPKLSTVDLRGALYVSRDRAPLAFPEDTLSSDGIEVMNALLQNPDEAQLVKGLLPKLQKSELSLIASRLIDEAQKESDWGTPPILTALIEIANFDPSQGTKISAFLLERPQNQIGPDIIPRIANESWAKSVLLEWKSSEKITKPVKIAIANHR